MNDSPSGIVPQETRFDTILRFTLPMRGARGRCVRLGPVVDEVLSAHDYPEAVRHALCEALVLTALMGSLIKHEDGQMTMQAQSDGGIIGLLACDYRGGELRGYVRHDAARLGSHGANTALADLFGANSYLAITFDLADGKGRYQGIVPLEGDTLTGACESYFRQSEQVPSVIRVAVRFDGERCVAGGMLVQHLPEGEEGRERLHAKTDDPDWEHVAILSGSVRHAELVDPGLSLEAVLWRLFHEEEAVRVEAGDCLSRGCRCSLEHYENVLRRFGEEERIEMRDPDGTIPVDCAFCSKIFRVEI